MGRNLLSLYALQGINSFAPLIVIPYLTRVLGPPGYGAIALYQSLIAYGVIFLDFGFYVSGVRDAARWRDDPVRLGIRFKAIMATKFLLLLAVAIGMAVAVLLSSPLRRDWILFFVCGIQLLGSAALPLWLFQGVEASQRVLLPQIIARLLTTALMFVFVRDRTDIVTAAVLLSSSDVLCALMLWKAVNAIADLGAAKVRWRDVGAILREDFSLFTISLGSNLCTAFNPLLIDVFYGHSQVAFYAVSLRIASVANRFTGPVIQSLSPQFSVLIPKNMQGARRLLFRSVLVLGGMAFVFGAVMLLFAPLVLHVFAGGQYLAATAVLRAFSPLPLLLVLSSLIGQNFAVHLGLGRSIAWIYWAVGGANLLLLLPLTRAFGAAGSAVTLVLTEFLIVALLCVLTVRRYGTELRRANASL